jgi:tRNA A-37 threonylcarbamoyl transferase component Bud32
VSVQPGETIGRYQILGPLGSGGMATVYKAFHPALDRTVALKVIRASFTDDAEFLERFRQEAKAVARLRHPNIVQVFDFDEVDGRHFIVMEYLEGGTLKQRLRSLEQSGQRIPRRELLRIVGEVADGLTYAHQFGILHRDVKPANVLLTRDGRAVVTDFGIARMVMSAELTRTGVGVGTPEYMSPEQARGEGVDERADLYSLAVMAYEMATGRAPFSADTPLAVVLKHLNDPLPPPSSIDPDIGESTDRVLMKALAKSPFDRYASATEFAQALAEAFAEDERDRTSTFVRPAPAPSASAAPAAAAVTVSAAPPPPARPRPAWLVPAVALAALVVVGGAGYAVVGGLGPRATPSASPAGQGPTSIVQQGGPIAGARFDGQVVTGGVLILSTTRNTPQGPRQSQFAPGDAIGFVLTTREVIAPEYVRSTGRINVEHPVQLFPPRAGEVASCCYIAPAQPGEYRLILGGNGGKVLAEIPYTVR